ncbi:MAG: hypothetical protein ABI353_22305 [Isosphaeraceae bacterium]
MRISLRRCAAVLVVVVGSVLLTGGARAEFITYTNSATMSGSLGGTNFTDSLVTLSMTIDTKNVDLAYAYPRTNESTATGTATVDGIGTATFTRSLRVINNSET